MKLDLKPSNCAQPRTSHPAFLNKCKKKVNLWRDSSSNRSSDTFDFKRRPRLSIELVGVFNGSLNGGFLNLQALMHFKLFQLTTLLNVRTLKHPPDAVSEGVGDLA